MTNDLLKISLNQGKKFNTYQTKIKNKEGFTTNKNLQEQEQMVRPVYDGYIPVIKNMQQSSSLINNANQNDLDELTKMQTKYNELIGQYTDIQKKIGDSSLNSINRLSTNNPYLNKHVLFTNGTIAYVTNQGIVKPYKSDDVFQSTVGKNGCPSKEFVKLDIPWISEYIKGSTIQTNPPLIVGSDMKMGESCGNEGSNVYASKLTNNPSSKYIGCYNDKSNSTNVNIVPVMNSSNSVNGFVSKSSSNYLDNNNYGPWAAFDQNPNTWWHSSISEDTGYNNVTGVYEGKNSIYIVNIGNIGGEFLQINMPGVNTSSAQNITINQYSLSPRLDTCCLTSRNPNSWYIIGWNDGKWYQVDRQQNQTFTNGTPKVYTVSNPKAYSAYILLVDKVGNNSETDNRTCVQVAEWNLFSNSDTTFTDDKRAMIWNPNSIGYTSFDKCQEYAADNGYQYFGLQDVQPNGTAICSVSNDIARTKIYGDANSQNTMIPIWSSNTSTGENSTFQLAGTGQITIIQPNGTATTVNNVVDGCTNWGTSKINTATYGGNCKAPIGNVTSQVTDKLGCNWKDTCSIPISNGTFGDPAPGCKKAFDIDYTCGGKQFTTNISYAEGQTLILDCSQHMRENCVFFLVLQDDGNMCIYKGKDPSDNKGGVWCTMTNNKQKSANPDWVASKGKFGRNYLKSGESLGSNEWIGSTDGSLKLVMQSDGNLVLYTSETKSGCRVLNDKTYGENWINSVYQLNETGNRTTLGKVGYIDSESNLREYPDSMIGFVNDYQIYQNTDSIGNDIDTIVVTDENGCKTACNNNSNCSAYVYQGSSNTCWLKSRSAYPKGEKQYNNSTILGIRTPALKGSTTCSNKIVSIDTVQYDNYIKGSPMTADTQCNSSIISQTDIISLDNVKTQLITLGNDIASKMENLYNQDKRIFEKLHTNEIQFKKDLEKYKLTNFKINRELDSFKNLHTNNIENMQNYSDSRNINGMLTDSDLRVLQANYSYIMWSILAVGALTITINTMKR